MDENKLTFLAPSFDLEEYSDVDTHTNSGWDTEEF